MIYFRADGDSRIGWGHVMRCLAVADMLKDTFTCRFVTKSQDPAVHKAIEKEGYAVLPAQGTGDQASELLPYIQPHDIVVLDGYHFDHSYQQAIRERGCRLVYIDDVPLYEYNADLIINHAPGMSATAYQAAPHTTFLLGYEYAILRPPFLRAARTPRHIDTISKAFINMGGSDIHNITGKAARAALACSFIQELHIVTGGSYLHADTLRELQVSNPERVHLHTNLDGATMCSLMTACHVAICPASTVSLELCSAGIGLVCGFTAGNQLNIYHGLESAGLIFPAGDLQVATEAGLTAQLSALDTGTVNRQVALQKKLVDGHSDERIRNAFKKLAHENLSDA